MAAASSLIPTAIHFELFNDYSATRNARSPEYAHVALNLIQQWG